MNPHKIFILTPVSGILEEANLAINPIGCGIETYPLLDYIMQSIFIKMTGSQEQKLKCIAWELATNDFEFRREFFKDFNTEFSRYEDKNKVYQKLLEQISIVKGSFLLCNSTRIEIRNKSSLDSSILNSNLKKWHQKEYENYTQLWNGVKEGYFANQEKQLLNSNNGNNICLQKIYKEHLYKNRNRIAHNTTSFQQNLPTLERLKSKNYQYENYFLWFSILILIDEIFMALYREYLKTLEQRKF